MEPRPGSSLHEDRAIHHAEMDVEVHSLHCATVWDIHPKPHTSVMMLFFPREAFLKVFSDAGGVMIPPSRLSSGRGG